MPTLMIAAASALLLAALVTETTQRFWPNSYIALLVITFVALFVNGLFNAKLKQTDKSIDTRQKPQRSRDQSGGQNRNQGRNRNQDRNQNADKRNDNRSANRSSPRNDDQGNRGRSEHKQNDSSRPPRTNQDRPKRDAQERKPAPEQAAEIAPRGPQETGIVKWFNRSKGYGFIVRDNGDEVFVHQRSIVTDGDPKSRPVLRDGQKVSFEVAHLEKGAQAEQVKGLD